SLWPGRSQLTSSSTRAILRRSSTLIVTFMEFHMNSSQLILALLDEGYEKPAWHGPNLKQSIRGVSAKQAAWRPSPGRHNIWEETLHAAYWKYAVRRRIEGGKRGSFALKGSNFFARPGAGKFTETDWQADKNLLER